MMFEDDDSINGTRMTTYADCDLNNMNSWIMSQVAKKAPEGVYVKMRAYSEQNIQQFKRMSLKEMKQELKAAQKPKHAYSPEVKQEVKLDSDEELAAENDD